MCMDGRIPNFNFITLLRPNPYLSYEDQRDELMVVPRAQFILIELSRLKEGCYDEGWREKRLLRVGRSKFNLFNNVIIVKPKDEEREKKIKDEAERVLKLQEDNLKRVRSGEQLKDCLPAKLASEKRGIGEELKAQFREEFKKLNDEKYVVIDDCLSPNICADITSKTLSYFKEIGHSLVSSQIEHRQDDVKFLPVFDESEHWLNPVRDVLANIANCVDPELLVPNRSQLGENSCEDVQLK